MKNLQLVNWFPYWKGFKFKRTNPVTDTNASYFLIYKWFVLFGFWELRKFMTVKENIKALKTYNPLKTKKQWKKKI